MSDINTIITTLKSSINNYLQHEIYGPFFFTICWWSCAITLTLINRYILAPEHLNFSFPILMTTIHSFGIACLIRCILKVPAVEMTNREYWRYIFPVGALAGLDITLTNASFMFLNITFVTLIKSTTLVWIVFIAILLKLEKPSTWLLSSTFLVCFGVILVGLSEIYYPQQLENDNQNDNIENSNGEQQQEQQETRFNLFGAFICLCASFAAAGRWTILQFLMQEGRHLTVTETLYYVMPIQVFCIFPIFLAIELKSFIDLDFFNDEKIALIPLFLLAGLFLAMGLLISEFLLVRKTSSVTLSIIG